MRNFSTLWVSLSMNRIVFEKALMTYAQEVPLMSISTCLRKSLHVSDAMMALFLSADAEIVPRRWSPIFFCPLWLFLRSGLAVPKAIARKPLPQKVSALDPGIGSRHRLSFSLRE